jgi:hypothetical protein
MKASGKQIFHAGFLLGLFFDPENGGDIEFCIALLSEAQVLQD